MRSHMLVDQNNANVLPLGGVLLERGRDLGIGGVGADDEEVSRRSRRVRDMLEDDQILCYSL